jgi:demethylmenaquinone methyltransferase/2-methoxy-6-polyprenyl-1,4-benzoquinol methylase
VSRERAVQYADVIVEHELAERLRHYYTRYYRDTLGIPGWTALVEHREGEERRERARLARVRTLVGAALARGPILNLGCGTGGFNAAAAESGASVIGVDADADAVAICALRGGRYVRAEGEALPFRDGAFALVHCFSVIEHVASVEATVAEMVRVTRPGGRVVVLDITSPRPPPLSWFFRLWFDRAVPLLGRLAADPAAYTYLPSSVRRFPAPRELAAELASVGLARVGWVLTAGGIIAIHAGVAERAATSPDQGGGGLVSGLRGPA